MKPVKSIVILLLLAIVLVANTSLVSRQARAEGPQGFFVLGRTNGVAEWTIPLSHWTNVLGANISELNRPTVVTILSTLSGPANEYFAYFGHGQKYKLSVAGSSGYLTCDSIRKAMQGRANYRLAILMACYSDSVIQTLVGTYKECTYPFYYRQYCPKNPTMSVGLAVHNWGYEEIIVPRINQFLSMVNDSSNYTVRLYDLWLRLGTTKGNDKLEDPVFYGDKNMRVCDIFNQEM